MKPVQPDDPEKLDAVRSALGDRSLVMVGLMGCGKSSVGRRLAVRLGIPFVDTDEEIERVAGKSIVDIFSDWGEAEFRDGERRVIARLLGAGPQVLATGGGAFINPETREKIKAQGLSVWLKAELPVLMRRVAKRDTRPLLKTSDPEGTMRGLMDVRYPIYAEADVTVVSRDVPHDVIVTDVIETLLTSGAMTRAKPTIGQSTMREALKSVGDSATPVRQVPVILGERTYDVLIGSQLLERAGDLIAAKFKGAKVGIVTDATVAGHHLAALERGLQPAVKIAGSIVLPAGEATKSFRELAPLCERLLELGLERGDLVLAFGGGVIGDLAGFAAGILRRGIRFVQVPTTLLAQVDSSVGGKTGINTPQGKNLIGVFHQPGLVLADTGVLATLAPREMRAGYAEVAKYGLLGDAAFFAWLEQNWKGVFALEPKALEHAIETSVRAKAAIVARDEHETGDRALLNLGHTFGHALEAWTGFSSRLLHGEGVAIGMALAFRFSEVSGLCPTGTADRVSRHLVDVGLPTRIGDIPGERADADNLMRLMAQDKKVHQGKATFILVRDIGQAFVTRDVDPASVRAFLAREIE